MEPWYRTSLPRKEVREGRSFNPDEFAIALEQWWQGPPRKIIKTRRNSSLAHALLGPWPNIPAWS